MELPNVKDIEASIHQAIQKAVKLIPDDMTRLREGIEKNLRGVLEAGFKKIDLVSREEFDIQSLLLQRTRERLEELQKQIDILEQSAQQSKNS